MKGARKGSGEAMQVARNGGVNTTKPRDGKEREERTIGGFSERGAGGGGAFFSSDENEIGHSYCEQDRKVDSAESRAEKGENPDVDAIQAPRICSAQIGLQRQVDRG